MTHSQNQQAAAWRPGISEDPAADQDLAASAAADSEIGQQDDGEHDDMAAVADDVLVVAEVIEEPPADGTHAGPDADPALADVQATAGGSLAGADLSQEWHDIQADFVDNPRAAVQRAAEAADAAVSVLATSLHERQTALLPADGDASAQDTERLRVALQGYRVFCQQVEDVGRQLPQQQGASR